MKSDYYSCNYYSIDNISFSIDEKNDVYNFLANKFTCNVIKNNSSISELRKIVCFINKNPNIFLKKISDKDLLIKFIKLINKEIDNEKSRSNVIKFIFLSIYDFFCSTRIKIENIEQKIFYSANSANNSDEKFTIVKDIFSEINYSPQPFENCIKIINCCDKNLKENLSIRITDDKWQLVAFGQTVTQPMDVNQISENSIETIPADLSLSIYIKQKESIEKNKIFFSNKNKVRRTFYIECDNADFSKKDLSFVTLNFEKDCKNINLSYAKLHDSTIFCGTLKNADLSGVDFRKKNSNIFTGCNVSECNLSGAKLKIDSNMDLKNCTLDIKGKYTLNLKSNKKKDQTYLNCNFDHLSIGDSGTSFLKTIDSISDQEIKLRLMSECISYLNQIDRKLLDPLIPSILDVLLKNEIYYKDKKIKNFIINNYILSKIEISKWEFIELSAGEVDLILDYIEKIYEYNKVHFLLEHKNLYNFLVTSVNSFEKIDKSSYQLRLHNLKKHYFKIPLVAQFYQQAKEANIWIDESSLKKDIQDQFEKVRLAAEELESMGLITLEELKEYKELIDQKDQDLEKLKEKVSEFSQRVLNIKGKAPSTVLRSVDSDTVDADTVNQSVDPGSGFWGQKGLVSQLKSLPYDTLTEQELDDFFKKFTNETFTDSALQISAENLLKNVLKKDILEIIKNKDIKKIEFEKKINSLVIGFLNKEIFLKIPLCYGAIEDSYNKLKKISSFESLIIFGEDSTSGLETITGLVTSVENLINFKNFTNIDWSSICILKKYCKYQGEVLTSDNTKELLKNIRPFLFFYNRYVLTLNDTPILKFLEGLELGDYKEPLRHATKIARINDHNQKLDRFDDQEKLENIFNKFYTLEECEDSVLPMVIEMNKDHLTKIYKAFSISDKSDSIKARYLFILALIFTKYSSQYLFGTESNSPLSFRKYAIGCLNEVCKLDSKLKEDKSIKRMIKKLAGHKKVFQCTAVLYEEMEEVCEQDGSLCKIYKEVV